jgi:hypothetical protein
VLATAYCVQAALPALRASTGSSTAMRSPRVSDIRWRHRSIVATFAVTTSRSTISDPCEHGALGLSPHDPQVLVAACRTTDGLVAAPWIRIGEQVATSKHLHGDDGGDALQVHQVDRVSVISEPEPTRSSIGTVR